MGPCLSGQLLEDARSLGANRRSETYVAANLSQIGGRFLAGRLLGDVASHLLFRVPEGFPSDP